MSQPVPYGVFATLPLIPPTLNGEVLAFAVAVSSAVAMVGEMFAAIPGVERKLCCRSCASALWVSELLAQGEGK